MHDKIIPLKNVWATTRIDVFFSTTCRDRDYRTYLLIGIYVNYMFKDPQQQHASILWF